jgi:hypothetical protein
MAIMAITAATPKMIPRAVSIDLNLFKKTASNAAFRLWVCRFIHASLIIDPVYFHVVAVFRNIQVHEIIGFQTFQDDNFIFVAFTGKHFLFNNGSATIGINKGN